MPEREIAYGPLPSQREFHRVRAKYKLFSGPVGSGKSAALVQEAIRLAIINAGLDGLIGAPTYRMLEDVTKKALLSTLEENQIPYRLVASQNKVILTDTDSEILFRSLEAPEKLVGTNLAWFGIDEVSFTKLGSFRRLQARLRHKQAKELCGFGATTPNGFNWVYDHFFGELKTDEFKAVKAVPGENTHLASGYYEGLAKTYDERFYRQEVLGEYLALQSGSAYHAFDRTRNIDDSLGYSSSCRLCWALDFNIDPACSVIVQIKNTEVDGKRHKAIEVIDEICVRDASVDLTCQAFIDRTKKLISPGGRIRVNIYGDAAGQARSHSGKSDWQMVREYFARWPEYELSFAVPSTNPAVKDRVAAVNGALYNSLGEVRLRMHSRCKSLIRDLERVVWKRDTSGNILSELDKKEQLLTHVSDALGYLVSVELPLANKVRVSIL